MAAPEYVNSHAIVFRNPAQYLKARLKVLSRDSYITPTDEEMEHLRTLETQVQIDNAIITIMNNRWDKY